MMAERSAMDINDLERINSTRDHQTQHIEHDRWLDAIFEIAKILVSEHDPDTMLQKFLDGLIKSFDVAETGCLLLYDPAEGELVVKAAHGYELNHLQGMRLSSGEARCGKAFAEGEAMLYATTDEIHATMSNMTTQNRAYFDKAVLKGKVAVSAVCIPLITGKAKVGVFMLENLHHPRSFVQADLPFLEAVADLIALAVENARLREDLQSAQAISEANRLKAEVISILAHEMRTPLTSIKGYSTALLMEEATFSAETQQEFLQIIDEECDILQNLIYDLLESSIIDAGLLRIELQPLRLPRLVKSVSEDITHHAGFHVMLDFPEDFPLIDADPDRIAQVLRNLLDNAVKYSPKGGLLVIRGEVCPNEIVVSVSDQGVGIAPEDLNRLFEKFFRVKSGLGRHVVGSGLGLPITQAIVESHGGRIWAESKVGQGSTFFFTLPLKGVK